MEFLVKNGENINVRKDEIEKLTDQDALAEIAKNYEDSDIRETAILRLIYLLTGKNLIFVVTHTIQGGEVLWNGAVQQEETWSEDKFDDAVLSLLANNILVLIAINITKANVDRAAIEKLNDRTLLVDVANNAKRIHTRIQAAKKIGDEQLAQSIYAKDIDKNDRVSPNVVEKLTNQNLLADVARNAKNNDVRIYAVEKLTNQNLLADIAKNDKNSFICLKAAEKLEDEQLAQSIFADIAKNAEDKYDCINAIQKLTEQNVLADIAINNKNPSVRETAVEKLTDQVLLTDVAKTSKDSYVRLKATERLEDKHLAQDIYADVAKNDTISVSTRLEATEKLENKQLVQSIYADIAQKDTISFSTRLETAEKLEDKKLAQSVYFNIVKGKNDYASRTTAVEKLKNPLKRIWYRFLYLR